VAATKSQPPAPAPTETPAAEPASEPEPTDRYEYTWGDPTQYPHIPLTAYPPRPAVPEVKAAPGVFASPAIPALPATVFAFPDGAPDGRWRPTDLPVNQAKDNEAPLVAVQEA
jgi:hypothetical protein